MSGPKESLPVLADGADGTRGPVDLALDLEADEPMSSERRSFLRTAAAGAAMATLSACGIEDFFRKSFRELSKSDVAALLARVEKKNSAKYGKQVTVVGTPARAGVEFGYGLDLSRCVGCRRCVYACVKENNQSRANPQIHWIRVLEMEKAHGVDLARSEVYYESDQVPRPGKFYFPVQCQQCRDPACVKACPTKATWKEADGIVVIDYDWCIGCRCCMSACPYGARHFNWATPTLPPDELNPEQHYLGNRPRPKGVVEKCTFCIQRTRNGRYPACLEACPVGARKFGNLLDPESEIRRVMETKRVFVFKEELATEPQFYYFYAT